MRFISANISRLEEAQEAVYGRDGGSLQKEQPASACTNSRQAYSTSLLISAIYAPITNIHMDIQPISTAEEPTTEKENWAQGIGSIRP